MTIDFWNYTLWKGRFWSNFNNVVINFEKHCRLWFILIHIDEWWYFSWNKNYIISSMIILISNFSHCVLMIIFSEILVWVSFLLLWAAFLPLNLASGWLNKLRYATLFWETCVWPCVCGSQICLTRVRGPKACREWYFENSMSYGQGQVECV